MLKTKLLITAVYLCLATIVAAQSGTIRGIVTEGKTGEEILGANVYLSVTGQGSTTGLDGTFEIRNVSPGTYKVICSYIGFRTDTTVVEIKSGQTVELTILLGEDSNLLQEVTVTGVRIASSDVAVLGLMRESMQVVSGLSSESIRRTQDGDAAQVVRRIPGVTVVGDRFIIVRGLNERYNSTMLNGANVPSLEADVRSFAFDILPSNLIDQVLIWKSPSPDLPGDFSGGAIRILSKSIPEENSTVLDISTAYRHGSSLKPFSTEPRRKGHWAGFNDGANDLPADFPGNLEKGLTTAEIDAAGRALPNNWREATYNSGLDYKISLTHNFRKDLGYNGMQIGNISSLLYSNSKTIRKMQSQSFEAYDFSAHQSKVRFSFDDVEYNQEITAALVHNWAFRVNANHVFEFKNLYSHLTSYGFIERYGEQVAQSFTQHNFAFANEYRGLYTGQLLGTHKFNQDATRVEWIGGFNYAFNELPDYRRYRRNVFDAETRESVILVPRGQTPDFLGKFYSSMRESMYSGTVHVEHRFFTQKHTPFQPVLKAGVFFEERERNFEARNLGYSRGFSFSDSLTQLGIDQLFDTQNISSEYGIKLGENFSPQNFFTASNRIFAAYMAVQIPLGKFNIFGGVRMEDNLQELRSPKASEFVIEEVSLDKRSFLPSLTLSYDIRDNMVIKTVYGKTLNRPEFREIAPYGFYDFVFDATLVGYSLLRNAEIDNFDLRWELYPSARETISLALFYKRFKNPIESLYSNFGSEQISFLFRNTESAVARGIELDLRKSLVGIFNSPFVDRFSVLANVSVIDSEVTVGEELEELLRSRNRPLQGQSGFIVNAGLFYDDLARKLQVNILYNVIGKRILFVSGPLPDTYEMPRNVLDINIRKRISDRLMLSIGARDILNQENLLLQDGNEDGAFNRKTDQVVRRYMPGPSFSLGVSYQLNY